MSKLTAMCPRCGSVDATGVVGGTATTFKDVGTRCPRCGGKALIPNGTYDFVGDTVAAFRAPGVTREKIERFREIAKDVEAGQLTAEQASSQVAQLGATLATVWNWTNSNAGALTFLISLLTAFLMVHYEAESNSAAEGVEQLAQRQTQVLEQIHAELRRQNVVVPKNLAPRQPKELTRKGVLAGTPDPVTRQQRRYAERKARKKTRPKP